MKLVSIILSLATVCVGLSIASYPDLNITTQSLAAKPDVAINKRYPESNYIRTPDTPQMFCSDTKNLTIVANNVDQNVTTGNCEGLRDMYAVNSSADGNGYWNFTFGASDRNDTGGLPQFTVDLYGNCELKMGLVEYSGVPLSVSLGNTDVYNFIDTAISAGNFSKATGQVGCNNNAQVVWAVVWIPGGIGR
ncbi:hypothetical protein VMCG_05560 [Cytospora schulzeri]|uniref:Ecp2 effector protein domain-containing protein n=1 Tax=Cytospora schulzeri TaxID=448051 RepID=A0A423WEK2_9PEZI|nr:hypothetical protein VMCG_05560 [Valsa malicola]